MDQLIIIEFLLTES